MDTKCMPCVQGKTAIIIGFFGTVYPLFASSVGNMMVRARF